MADYHVGCGLTAIYAGTLNKNNTMWTNKSDVTSEAMDAVAQYLIEHSQALEFDYDGKRYRLAVCRISDKESKKHRNACGSCKYFEEAEVTNKPWRKCSSVYKRGVHAGERRLCYPSMGKCCDYVRKEEKNDENN